MINIAIVEKNLYFRKGLIDILSKENDMDVSMEFNDCADFVKSIRNHKGKCPDVFVLHYYEWATQSSHCLSFLNSYLPNHYSILINHTEKSMYTNWYMLSTTAVLDMNFEPKELNSLIRGCKTNHHPLRKNSDLKPRIDLNKKERITKSELEVLKLVARGYTNKEIAHMLNRSKRTIEGHRFRLKEKVDVKNTAELVSWAVKRSLI